MVFAIQKPNLVDIQRSRFRWYSFVFEKNAESSSLYEELVSIRIKFYNYPKLYFGEYLPIPHINKIAPTPPPRKRVLPFLLWSHTHWRVRFVYVVTKLHTVYRGRPYRTRGPYQWPVDPWLRFLSTSRCAVVYSPKIHDNLSKTELRTLFWQVIFNS